MVGLITRLRERKAEQVRVEQAQRAAYSAALKAHREEEEAKRLADQQLVWDREDNDRRLERAHQLAIVEQITKALEVITEGSAKQAEENTKAISELAKSSAAQAEAFSSWISSFQVSAPPTSSVVRDEDELAEEEARLLADMPEEFRLAFSLHQDDFMADVKKDIRP